MGLGSRIQIINAFIKNPNDVELKVSLWEKVKFLITAVVYDFGFAFAFVIIISMLEPLMEPYENLLNADHYSIWNAILLICIITPMLEESIFRLPLKYKRNYIFKVIASIFKTDFSKFWKRHIRIIVYIFSATFGFIHLGNYTNVDLTFFILAPVIVGAQLFAGIIFSFLRLKLGFIWAVLGHFSHNFILIMMSFLFYHNVERVMLDSEEVLIEATGIAYTVDRSSRLNYDSLKDGNLLCLAAENYSLQRLVDTLYPGDSLKIRDNDQLDLKLISKKPEGYSKADLLEVLKENYTFKKIADSTTTD